MADAGGRHPREDWDERIDRIVAGANRLYAVIADDPGEVMLTLPLPVLIRDLRQKGDKYINLAEMLQAILDLMRLSQQFIDQHPLSD